MPTVTVNKVKCHETTDGWGADDLYISINGEKVWPYFDDYEQIDEGEEKRIGGASRYFHPTANVDLWEYDSGSDDDHIGTILVGESTVGDGEYYITLDGDGSRYDVYLEVTG